MKKLLCFLLILFFVTPCLYAKKKPDPLYLNSDVIDMDVEAQKSEEKQQKKREKKEKKLQKKIEKARKSGKINFYEAIDKSQTPITTEDYDRLSQEVLRTDFEIPTPEFEESKDFILPDPQFRVISYNSPPGQRNIDIRQLSKKKVVTSPAILSPDKGKMVYTKSFFYPQKTQTASAVYYIPIKNGFSDAYDILYKTNVVEGSTKPILTAGANRLEKFQFKTLFPIDFSKDGKKIALKEKIGSNMAGTWVTNIILYDFEKQSAKELTSLRDSIVNYWRNKDIELKDYMWDIYPIGWDSADKNKIMAYAYAYTNDKPLFLGTWSINAINNISKLESRNSTQANIELNGFGLLEIKN